MLRVAHSRPLGLETITMRLLIKVYAGGVHVRPTGPTRGRYQFVFARGHRSCFRRGECWRRSSAYSRRLLFRHAWMGGQRPEIKSVSGHQQTMGQSPEIRPSRADVAQVLTTSEDSGETGQIWAIPATCLQNRARNGDDMILGRVKSKLGHCVPTLAAVCRERL